MLELNPPSDRSFTQVVVPDHEKHTYMMHFDQLWRAVHETEPKLGMYHAVFGDETSTNRLVSMVSQV